MCAGEECVCVCVLVGGAVCACRIWWLIVSFKSPLPHLPCWVVPSIADRGALKAPTRRENRLFLPQFCPFLLHIF